MTVSIVEALEKLERPKRNAEGERDAREKNSKVQGIDGEAQEKNEKSTDSDHDPSVTAQKQSSEPSLYNPKVGNPISHGQVVDIARDMKARRIQPSGLEALLKGSRVYVPAPLPKLEPVSGDLHSVFRIGADILSTDFRIQSSHDPSPSRGRRTILRTNDLSSSTHGDLRPTFSRILRCACILVKLPKYQYF